MIFEFKDKYDFLSNFYESPIVYDSLTWRTAEHAYQAAKTNSINQKIDIWRCVTPGLAKQMGKKVDLRGDWETLKLGIMKDILMIKFQDPVLKQKLLATGRDLLIEGNTWHDNFWGHCYCWRCHATDGENHLGKLLMEIRLEIG